MFRSGAPERGQALVAPAGPSIELVRGRVLAEILAVVFLRGVEGPRLGDLRVERLAREARVLLERRLACLGGSPLFRRVDEDGGSILVAAVAELAVLHRRVDVVPIDVEQLVVADLRG